MPPSFGAGDLQPIRRIETSRIRVEEMCMILSLDWLKTPVYTTEDRKRTAQDSASFCPLLKTIEYNDPAARCAERIQTAKLLVQSL